MYNYSSAGRRDPDQYMYSLLRYGLALVLYYDQKKKKKRNKWSDSGHNQDIVGNLQRSDYIERDDGDWDFGTRLRLAME